MEGATTMVGSPKFFTHAPQSHWRAPTAAGPCAQPAVEMENEEDFEFDVNEIAGSKIVVK